MATQNSGLKVPTRPAPGLPSQRARAGRTYETEESVDPFSPVRSKMGLNSDKKVAPPRPPPPKVFQQPNTHSSRSIFGTGKKKQQKAAATAIVKPMPPPTPSIPTATLIDLQSPPSSPIFESKLKNSLSYNKSSNIKNCFPESGFEDDFNSLISSTATSPGFDPWSNTSDYSPSPTNFQPPPQPSVLKPKATKPINVSKPTIICVPTDPGKGKPSRPPPPKSSQLLNDENHFREKEGSPPMPTCPPPPPPPEALGVLFNGPSVPPRPSGSISSEDIDEQPHCIACYDYTSTHPDDLSFKTGDRIVLVEKVSDEWLKGSLDGNEGIFPQSYVNVVVPIQSLSVKMRVIAVYPYRAETWDDLELSEGDEVDVFRWINEDWLYGESDGKRGQFPSSFVQDITDLEN